ncbi:MAG: hypothetical protein ACRECH_10075 [Nitrososphaerales archaeon]
MSTKIEADIAQRTKFYNAPDVARALSKYGVPKSKKAMSVMISEGSASEPDSVVTQELIDCLGFVVFAVHPQQINIRDKANGKIIAVISR